jgi:DNA-binding transcriptional ArsR family regulator
MTRLKIVRALIETPLAASDLARGRGRSAAATSQHMRVLREPSAVILEAIARSLDLLAKRE